MGKCLITKLQGTVKNSELLKIGESRVLHTRSTSDSADLRSFSIEVVTNMIIKGHGLTIDNQDEVEVAAGDDRHYNVSNGNGYVEIPDRQNLLGLKVGKTNGTARGNCAINLQSLHFAKNLQELYVSSSVPHRFADIRDMPALSYLRSNEGNFEDNISSIGTLPALEGMYISDSDDVHGDLSGFTSSKFPKLKTLLLVNLRGVNGDISSFASLTSLETLSVMASPYITGDISNLASGMVANGRTSGTLIVTCTNSGVTLNGEPLTTSTITFDSEIPGGYSMTTVGI